MQNNNDKKNKGTNQRGLSLSFGIAMGCALGLIFDNIALGISIGVALGLVFRTISNGSNKDDQE